MRRILSIVLAALAAASISYAQEKVTLSGYVVDGERGETLIGAGISCAGTGTVTNAYGFYSLSVEAGKHSVTFSYVGYSSQVLELDLRSSARMVVRLSPGPALAEAVVIAPRESGIRSSFMGALELPPEMIRNTPVVFGEPDVLKSVQLLPGVQSGLEGSAGIFVRGGGVDENLFLLDGVPLYNVSHLLGLFSAFTPEAVKNVTFYKGSFPARYGGRVSSIVDVRTNDGDLHHFHGTASIGLLNDRLHLEGPVVKEKTSFSLTARGMHTLLLTPVLNWTGSRLNYYYYDLNAKLTHTFSPSDRLYLSVYHGKDVFSYRGEEKVKEIDFLHGISREDIAMQWGNTVASLRWNHVPGPRLFVNTTLAYYLYDMDSGYTTVQSSRKTESSYFSAYGTGIRDLLLNVDLDYSASATHLVRTGLSAVRHTYLPQNTRIKQDAETADTTFSTSHSRRMRGWEVSGYAEDDMRLADFLSVNAGLRYTWMYTEGTSYHSWQPRLSLRTDLGKGFSLKASYARMAQYVHLLSTSQVSMPTDLWVPITRTIEPVFTDQESVGAYYEGLPGWEFSLEAYLKQSRNVIDYRDGISFFGTSADWEDMVESGEGRSRGIELYVQKKTGKATGWISYTLAKTERRFPEGYINNGEWFPYKYDRRHNLSVNVGYQFSPALDLHASWNFTSGCMMTLPERETLAVNPRYEFYDDMWMSSIPSRNNFRLPPSHRLNLGLNLHRKARRGESIWNFSLYNAYDAMNPNLVFSDIGFLEEEGRVYVRLRKITYLPILPSVGYTFKF